MLRLLTAGESHGEKLTLIIEGLPRGLAIDRDFIAEQLKFRRLAAGRSDRQKLEGDEFEITSGVSNGVTTAAPMAVTVYNASHEIRGPLHTLRAGHADYAGAVKYGLDDARIVAERASARETVMRTFAGAVAQLLLKQLFIEPFGYVCEIGGNRLGSPVYDRRNTVKNSVYRCDAGSEEAVRGAIAEAAAMGDSLGGKAEVVFYGVPAGFGNYNHFDRKLDAALAFAAMSVQAVKAVEIGSGCDFSGMKGSLAADTMQYVLGKVLRQSNHAGGIEGGVSNGENIVVRATIKPVPTIPSTLPSINIKTKSNEKYIYERSDICAVPAAAVILENALSFCLADFILTDLGGDTMDEVLTRYILKREKNGL